jgi:hypothetical protein
LTRPEAEGAIGDSTACTLFDGADVAFDFGHMLVLIAAFQVHTEILPQWLKFGVTVDTSDLEATGGVNSSNTVDRRQKVPTGARVQEFNGAKAKVS